MFHLQQSDPERKFSNRVLPCCSYSKLHSCFWSECMFFRVRHSTNTNSSFYVYKTTRLFYVTRGSAFLMFRCIYNLPRSLWTSPLHYFSKSVPPPHRPQKFSEAVLSAITALSLLPRAAQHQRAGLLF